MWPADTALAACWGRPARRPLALWEPLLPLWASEGGPGKRGAMGHECGWQSLKR